MLNIQIVTKSILEFHPLFPLLQASFPPFGLMISERLHDVHDVQEHLGGDKRRVDNVVSLSPQLGSVPDEESTWKAWRWWNLGWRRKKKREWHMLSENQGRPTAQVDEKWLIPFVSRRGWGSGRIDDEIRGLYRHLLKQQASMPSPRPKVWWAEAARIVESTQVTELTISSCSDPTQATLKWF